MRQVDAELDRYLTLIRNKIRQRAYTQLEVQRELRWGRSYISQLLTKQKGLRVEQVLLILKVIGVDPVGSSPSCTAGRRPGRRQGPLRPR